MATEYHATVTILCLSTRAGPRASTPIGRNSPHRASRAMGRFVLHIRLAVPAPATRHTNIVVPRRADCLICIPYDCRNVATLKRSPGGGNSRYATRPPKARPRLPQTAKQPAQTARQRSERDDGHRVPLASIAASSSSSSSVEYRLPAFEGRGQFYEIVIVPTRHKNTNDLCD